MKRVFAILLCAAILLSCLAAAALADPAPVPSDSEAPSAPRSAVSDTLPAFRVTEETDCGSDERLFSDVEFPDGFYLLGSKLYAVQGGHLLTQSGRLNGTDFTCAGQDGSCRVRAAFLTLADGEICVLKNGTPWLGRGYFEYDGGLYYGQADGTLLKDGSRLSMHFDKNGRYTSGNAQIDAFVDAFLASVTEEDMTQEQKLRACYDEVSRSIDYLPNNNHVPLGAAPETWTEEYMLCLIERGKGNCYAYAAEMYYLARRLGYEQARAISGQDCPNGYRVDHGWLEIQINGVRYLFDPEMNATRYLYAGRLFMKTYRQTPWRYYPYY